MHSPEDLRRLSALLDEALDLPESERTTWLEGLPSDAARLAPALRAMLAQAGLRETADLLERGPSFTAVDDRTAEHGFAAGDTVGPYRLVRELGRGGMGEVWLAERIDGHLKRAVALKLPMLGLRRSMLVERFARERDILGALVHPHIARLYDAGISADGQPYMALEYVEGESLLDYCDEKRLGTAQRVAMAMQVLDAVQYAHTRLVIHRDLKPGNILVTEDGQVRLLDFGVAKLLADDEGPEDLQLTKVAGQAFTPDYASPEQVRGDNLTTASDVYSLGVVLYELLCGRRPYRVSRGTAAQLEQAILEADPPSPSSVVDEAIARLRCVAVRELRRQLQGDLDTIVLKALKKRTEDRYGTVTELAEDLARHRDGKPVLARPDSFAYRARKYVLRNKLVAGSGAAVVLALGSGLGLALWQAGQAREQARIAREEAQTSKAVQGFMEGIFRANLTDKPDTQKARETTVEELLELAGSRAERAMTDAPLARMKMLTLVSRLNRDLGNRGLALKLAQAAAEQANDGTVSVSVRIEALLMLSDMLSLTGRIADAGKSLDAIEALCLEMHFSDPHVLNRIDLERASISQMLGSNSEADKFSARALGRIRSETPTDDDELFYALYLQAFLLINNRAKAAELLNLATEAQQVFERNRHRPPGPNGLDAVESRIESLLAYAELNFDRYGNAERHARNAFEAALALSGRSRNLPKVFVPILTRGMLSVSKPLDAIAVIDRVFRPQSTSADSDSAAAGDIPLLFNYALLSAAVGREELCLDFTRRSERLLTSTSDLAPEISARYETLRSQCLTELGLLKEADEARKKAEALMPGGKEQPAALYRLRAEWHLAAKNANGAVTVVQMWKTSKSPPEGTRQTLSAQLLLAEAALVDQRWEEVDRYANEALARIAAFNERAALADLEGRWLWLRGRTSLGQRNPSLALPELTRSVALLERTTDPSVSLLLAHVLGSLAQAQFRTGQVTQAQEAFRRMKSIHARHPNLGPSLRDELAAVRKEVARS